MKGLMMNGPVGTIRSSVSVILLSIITLGIYAIVWQYKSFKELKDRTGHGIGGGLGLLFALIFSVVNAFLLPAEIGDMYAASGGEKPVSAKTGWWVFLPLVGAFIWVVKVQGSLNRYWEANDPGASAAVEAA